MSSARDCAVLADKASKLPKAKCAIKKDNRRESDITLRQADYGSYAGNENL
ncbi:MAG TPA: hypothetical protein VGW39_06050 [Chthoniobacterales bacterium]|nr:hypothetical protein [Chthoniobacterales bacterium]